MRASWIEVDLDALRKNTALVQRRLSPGTKLLVPLKANAYGHGAVQCARVFAEMGADYFGVAIPEEGVELRRAGFRQPILVFGYTFPEDYDLLFSYDLIPNVCTVEQAEALSRLAKKPLPIHISVDTGLHRLGFSLDEHTADDILHIAALPNLQVEGIFSMLATGYQWPDTAYSDLQFKRFTGLCQALAERGLTIPMRHICDSGAAMLFPHMHLEMVRPGTILYGTDCGDALPPGEKLYPAMSVKSRLACIRAIGQGEPVGYECTWTAPRPSVIGVVPCGFADGIGRTASGRGQVLVRGKRCPIVGNVCMDQMMIDLTEVEEPAAGDEVVLAGSQGGQTITLVEAGHFAGTSDTEFICRLGRRLPLRYLEGGKVVAQASDTGWL